MENAWKTSKRTGPKIPASISNLCNLQTLIVMWTNWRDKAIRLPSEILKMPWLRHLLVKGHISFSFASDASNGNLQQLSGLSNIRFTKGTIENILDLKTLGIVYNYNRGTNWSFYCLDNLVHLHQLEKLKLNFRGDHVIWLPANLSFPQKLNKLTLDSCKISSKQMSIIGSLPNLQVLKLKRIRFQNSVWETNEEQFLTLKFLHIEAFQLEHWEAEATHFPSLECLSLRHFSSLKCIPPGFREIPTLRDIVLCKCSEGVVDLANEILKEQREFGNESFQLHERSYPGTSFFKKHWW